jgi:hypothetical protein
MLDSKAVKEKMPRKVATKMSLVTVIKPHMKNSRVSKANAPL